MKHPNRIKELCDHRGVTQADLARLLDRAPPEVNRLINGQRPLTADWLSKIAAALMVQRDEIYQEHPPALIMQAGTVREAAGLSQEDLAQRLGWSPLQLRIVEAATQFPPLEIMHALADALGCSSADLWSEPVFISPKDKAFLGVLSGLSESDRDNLFRLGSSLAQSFSNLKTGKKN